MVLRYLPLDLAVETLAVLAFGSIGGHWWLHLRLVRLLILGDGGKGSFAAAVLERGLPDAGHVEAVVGRTLDRRLRDGHTAGLGLLRNNVHVEISFG